MEVTFSITYEGGNELRVSLSTFSKESLGEELLAQLGSTELVDVTLLRQRGDLIANWKTLNSLITVLGKIIHENQDVIFYYYCDELNLIPNMRHTRGLTPAEYRNKLFSILFNKGRRMFPDDSLVDDLITINTDIGTAYVHLIYQSHLSSKADLIKDELIDLASK